MHQRQRSADDQAGDIAVRDLRGRAQHREYKDRGQDDLNDERLHDTSVIQAVAAKSELRSDEHAQDSRSADRAEELRRDVADEIRDFHTAVQKNADGDRRVDVATGHIADRIRHRDNHQTERERGQNIRAIRLAVAPCHRCNAARHQHQYKCSDELRQILTNPFCHTNNLPLY